MDSLMAQGYSAALYEIACDENKSAEYKRELAEVESTLHAYPDLLLVLNHPKIEKAEKKAMLEKIFQDNISHTLLNFLKLLLDKSRFRSIFDIIHAFTSLYNDEHGIEIAHVTSAKELSSEEVEEVKQMLEKKLNKHVELVMRVDASLLAGLRVKINDEVIDNTAKSRLTRLKHGVLNSSLQTK